MKIEKASIVMSTAGRDKGTYFVVKEMEGENFALIVNGKNRKLENPKRKKVKHLVLSDEGNERLREKLLAGEKVTNAEIRRALSELFGKQQDPTSTMEG